MVTLVATIWIASWSQNKRFDDLRGDINRRFEEVNRRFDDVSRRFGELQGDINRRLDQVNVRLERIEGKLDGHEARIVRLEERSSLIRG